MFLIDSRRRKERVNEQKTGICPGLLSSAVRKTHWQKELKEERAYLAQSPRGIASIGFHTFPACCQVYLTTMSSTPLATKVPPPGFSISYHHRLTTKCSNAWAYEVRITFQPQQQPTYAKMPKEPGQQARTTKDGMGIPGMNIEFSNVHTLAGTLWVSQSGSFFKMCLGSNSLIVCFCLFLFFWVFFSHLFIQKSQCHQWKHWRNCRIISYAQGAVPGQKPETEPPRACLVYSCWIDIAHCIPFEPMHLK